MTGDGRREVGRSGTALALGAVAFAGAWLFGSLALAPVGIGLLLAGAAARTWRRSAAGSLRLERRPSATRLTEGEPLRVELAVTGGLSRWMRVAATERVGGRAHEVPLRRGRGAVVVEAMPRGRHVLGPAELSLEDPLGLERVRAQDPGSAVVVVRPAVTDVEALFVDHGRDGFDGRRARALRPGGMDLHGVRDYRDGEPLRLVHWPTSARRDVLAVVERLDAPREGTVVLLDGDPAGDVGDPGQSSFDAAVRVAASLVRARAARRRDVLLVLGGGDVAALRVTGLDGSWEAALDALAALRADGRRTVAGLLRDPSLFLAHRAELLVVTCRPETAGLLDPRRARGVVLVDAATFAGAPSSRPAPELLRLAGAGVAVTVVRAGDDLRAVLGGGRAGARTA